MVHPPRPMTNRELLISVLHEPTLNLPTIAIVCDAISADARFNTWVVAVAKKKANQQELLELMELYDRLADQCAAAIKKGARDAVNFGEVIEAFTIQITSTMRERFAS